MSVMAMTLRTDEELDAALSELSEAEGRSKQEVIRLAVLERHGRTVHRAEVDKVMSEALVEWKDVLDRLGSV
jgi:predicted transcriptional regulator